MDYVGISPNAIMPQPFNGDSGLPALISDTATVREMLIQPPTGSADTNSEKSALSDKSIKRRSLKRKHMSNQNTRKGIKAKRAKGSEGFPPNESPMTSNLMNGQTPCTPASSSSPGECLSERKLVGSSIDNVYEFTEQEEGHKLPDESLLKRKRSTRNYGKPKNRWLLEAEMKSISESRQRSYNENNQTELLLSGHSLPSNLNSTSNERNCTIHRTANVAEQNSRVLNSAGILQCPKIRINRNPSKNGSYECHIIERNPVDETTSATSSLISYRTECGDIFSVGDVVWAKLVGWPWWPAKLQSFYANSEGQHSGTAEVRWFNWDQISYVKCEKLYHFLAAYNSKLDKRRKAGAYKAAVDQALKEAMLFKQQQVLHNSSILDDDDDDGDDCCNDGDDESNDSFEEDSFQLKTNLNETLSKRKLQTNVTCAETSKDSELKIKSYAEVPSLNPSQSIESAASYVSPVFYSKDPNAAKDGDRTREANECNSKDSIDSRTSSQIIPQDFDSHYDFFDPSVAVGNAFDAFEESSVRNEEMVNLVPLVDIGPNLSLLNPKSIYSCIPSFSDDDELDMRPVLDPASIENV